MDLPYRKLKEFLFIYFSYNYLLKTKSRSINIKQG